MARLPTPGSDDGTWGGVLNDYLSVALDTDGTLKTSAIPDATAAAKGKVQLGGDLAGGTADAPKVTGLQGHPVGPAAPADGQTLVYNSTASQWEPATVTGSGTVPDATASTPGIIQLSGDLGGSATSPTVPGLTGKEPSITAGTNSQYWRGDKSWQTLDKTAVGLANVDNTSDAAKNSASVTLTNKTISGANNTLSSIPEAAVTNLTTDLSGKEPAVTAGTTSQYWRGDKSWQTLDKTAVGLANVDNTSDAGKPVSTATQTALNAKQDTSAKNAASGYAGLDSSGHTALALLPAGSTLTVAKDATTGFWPASYNADGTPNYTAGSASAAVRPTSRSDVIVIWKGPDPSPGIVASGTGGMLDNVDMRFVTP